MTAASVWVSEWVLYPPENLQDPKTADREQLRRYFQDALDWLRENGYLVKLAVVHLDETTVHAHIDTVPLTQDGRLSRKEVYTRAALNGIHTDLAKHLADHGWDIQRGESTKGKQVRSLSTPEYKKQAEAEKLQLIAQVDSLKEQLAEAEKRFATAESRLEDLQRKVMVNHDLMIQQASVIAEQEQRIADADEWLQQIPDWPNYNRVAMDAWHLIDQLRKKMEEVFASGWIFRNKAGERQILDAISELRDRVMTALSALRGYETRECVPEAQQRSQILSRSLDDIVRDAAARAGKQEQIEERGKDDPER